MPAVTKWPHHVSTYLSDEDMRKLNELRSIIRALRADYVSRAEVLRVALRAAHDDITQGMNEGLDLQDMLWEYLDE